MDLARALSGQAGFGIARRAIQSLEEHALAPLPAAYEVFLHFHAGTSPDVRAEVEALINRGGALNDYIVAQIHERCIGEAALSQQVIKAGDEIAQQITTVMKGLETAERRTRAYGQRLEHARNELTSVDEAGALTGLVDSLVGATGEMARQSKELEERLSQSAREVEVLRAELEKAQTEAATDSLTGVANRKVFEARLTELCEAHDRGGPAPGLLLADIDLFKQVNDTWGHQTGDQVIRFVASIIQRHAPEAGLVARMGGEEFALLVSGQPDKALLAISEAVRTMVEGKRLIRRSSNEELGRITVSLGVGQRKRGEERSRFIERVDAALYASKRAGRNRVTLAEPAVRIAA